MISCCCCGSTELVCAGCAVLHCKAHPAGRQATLPACCMRPFSVWPDGCPVCPARSVRRPTQMCTTAPPAPKSGAPLRARYGGSAHSCGSQSQQTCPAAGCSEQACRLAVRRAELHRRINICKRAAAAVTSTAEQSQKIPPRSAHCAMCRWTFSSAALAPAAR